MLGALELLGTRQMPAWLSLDVDKRQITVLAAPIRSQIDVPGPGAAHRGALLQVAHGSAHLASPTLQRLRRRLPLC